MNYAGNLHNTLENLMMMSAAEDQDMVNEQIANKDNRILDHQSSFPAARRTPSPRATASSWWDRSIVRPSTAMCSCSSCAII